MNTKIEYLYRDAANWKRFQHEVVAGEISEKQKAIIFGALQNKENFIPSQVGMRECRFDTVCDDDHVWFELWQDAFSPTNEPPTLTVTADELANAFAARKDNWDEALAYAQMVA